MGPPGDLSPLVAHALASYRDRLRARFGARLRELRLFGSYARGEADEDSDVDVFVLLDAVDWATRREVYDLAGDVFAETGLLLAPTVLDEERARAWRAEERPLIRDIDREGVPL